MSMDSRGRAELDRHITGNYGEYSVPDQEEEDRRGAEAMRKIGAAFALLAEMHHESEVFKDAAEGAETVARIIESDGT